MEVNHDILPQKLLHYGYTGITYKWFCNYVHNRQQFVNFNGWTSNRAVITYGVQQGSVLGPLLFLIYIDSLSAAASSLFPIHFADNTNLFLSHADFAILMNKANTDLENISKWFKFKKKILLILKNQILLYLH